MIWNLLCNNLQKYDISCNLDCSKCRYLYNICIISSIFTSYLTISQPILHLCPHNTTTIILWCRSSPSSSAEAASERLGSNHFGTVAPARLPLHQVSPGRHSCLAWRLPRKTASGSRPLRLRFRCQREKHHRLTSFDPFPRHSRPDRPSIIPGPIEALIHSVRASSAHRPQSTKKGNSVPPWPAPSYTDSFLLIPAGWALYIFSDIHWGVLLSSLPTTGTVWDKNVLLLLNRFIIK